MKPLKLILSVIAFATCTFSQAQVSVNINLGNPPAWGPSGYKEVRYYYLPDIYSYYDVGTHEFIYTRNGTWVRTTALPTAYRRYNLYNGYKVIMADYRGAAPYVYYKNHKVKYPKGYRPGPQKTIGLPPGQAKKIAAGHPHAEYRSAGKGHGHGHDHGKGKKH